MASNTPKFWYKRKGFFPNLLSNALLPISKLYKLGDTINKSFKKTREISLPIICVGNLNIGGAGKTPTCIALSKIVTEENSFMEPVFLTRGYGGNILGPEFVDQSQDAQIWGDEALLLSQHARTVVSQNRYQGAQLASHSNADIVIMDDGFQNNSLRKDINLIVVDGNYGFGNKKTIPSGPLREPLKNGLEKADAFIIIGEDNYGVGALIPENKPAFHAVTKIRTGWKIDKKKDYIAFCGIAHPQKFRQTLVDHGVNVVELTGFPDHHKYSHNDIKKLLEKAKKKNCTLITTEKDLVRISDKAFKAELLTLPIETHFSAAERKKLHKYITHTLEQKKNEKG